MGERSEVADREVTAPLSKPPQITVAKWVEGQVFEAGVPGRPSLRVDGKSKAAPSPFDALMIAIGTCAAVDVVEIMGKRRTPVSSLEVETKVTRSDESPRCLKHVWLTFRMVGEGIDRPNAERAIELSVNKYCSVRNSLNPGVPVEWKLELNGDSGS